jgi:hypothetical protein
MAIISITEESSSGQQLIGGTPQFTRTFTVLLTDTVSPAALAAACGVLIGSPHPNYPFAVVVDVAVEQARLEAPLSSPQTPEEQDEAAKEEAQQNTPLPLPPDEILESELPVLIAGEEEEEEEES